MKNTEGAFRWIISILDNLDIQFQISGGFASRLYGSKRELADIDIGVSDEDIHKLFPRVKEYIVYGPKRYKDNQWDLELMTLEYGGQEIDISGEDSAKFFDKELNQWVSDPSDITDSDTHTVYGIIVPVIRKEKLISYKKRIGREVDIEDVKSLESAESKKF